MIIASTHDGAKFDETIIRGNGFSINPSRDIKSVSIYDQLTGEKTDQYETIFDFVGFVSNKENDLFFVFPKHYTVSNVEADSRLTFSCIAKHMQKRPELYIGENSHATFESNYPFASFFEIYNYYSNYGLYIEEKTFIKPNTGGRVSWKDTISRCNKYLVGGNIALFPLYYRRNYHFSNFVTECMIYAIDYTLNKFGFLLWLEPTGEMFPEMDMLEEKNYVINLLQQLRQQTFKDNEQTLIDNLIYFFSSINVGGSFYLKHYTFSSVWEDMVTNYLCSYYKEISTAHEIVFDKVMPAHIKFSKTPFHTNDAKQSQYISPDHYGADHSNQLIFDAKYYNSVTGMNYKQIAYVFMLREMRDCLTSPQKYARTYSALILPSENRSTKMHFKMNPIYGKSSSDVIITEEYVVTVDVMKTYIEN